jgi:hypothetical protein
MVKYHVKYRTRKDEMERGRITLLLCTSFSPDITLLGDGKFDTLSSGERNPGLDTLADDKDIRNTEKR